MTGVSLGVVAVLLLTILRAIGWGLFAVFLLVLPYLCLAFGVGLTTSSVWLWGYGMPEVLPFLKVMRGIHVVGTAFSIAFVTTVYYQRCHSGGKTFQQYFRQLPLRSFATILFCSAIWPFYLAYLHFFVLGNYSYSSLGNEILLVGKFWYGAVRGQKTPLGA